MEIRISLILLVAVVFSEDSTDNKIIGGELAIKPISNMTVVAGVVNLAKTDFSSYRKMKVNNVTHHPKCERPKTGWNWDFGLVQINGLFDIIPKKLQTINLPKFPEIPGMIANLSDIGVHCVGAGWGLTAEKSGSTSPQLHKVDLKLLPLKMCEETLEKYAEGILSNLRFKPDTQVCTIGEKGKDACEGDSGGPLLCDTSPIKKNSNETEGKTLEMIATVSWGIGCGRPGVPGGWARLDVVYDWIVDTMDEFQRTARTGENDHTETQQKDSTHQKKTTTGNSLASADFVNVLVELIWISQWIQFCAIVHVNQLHL